MPGDRPEFTRVAGLPMGRRPARLLVRKPIFNRTFNLQVKARSQRERDRRLQPFAGGGSGLPKGEYHNKP